MEKNQIFSPFTGGKKKKKEAAILQGVQGFQAMDGSESRDCFIKFTFHFQHAHKLRVDYNAKRVKTKK